MKEQKAAVMDQILSAEARVRLANIAVVKPEKAEKLENIIIQNAQRGMFQGKVSEAQLLDLLNQFGEMSVTANSEIVRSKHKFDEEDEIDIDNLDL